MDTVFTKYFRAVHRTPLQSSSATSLQLFASLPSPPFPVLPHRSNLAPYDRTSAVDEFDQAEDLYKDARDDKCIAVCGELHDSNKTPPYWRMRAHALGAWATDDRHTASLKYWYFDYLLLHQEILYDKRSSLQLQEDIEDIERNLKELADSLVQQEKD